jgi:molybdopterin/thiamine biosynthesis adenylyltransferase
MNTVNDSDVLEMLRENSEKMVDPAGREVQIIRETEVQKISDSSGRSIRNLFLTALKAEICPYRYLRNRKIISIEEQIRLAESCAAVVGSGGLGGNVILLLARLGIGCLLVVDHDVFDETNLNRQALSDTRSIGTAKSQKAADQVASINPAVDVHSLKVQIDHDKALEIFDGVDVVVDALDNIPDRFVIEKAAKTLGVPFIHGAIAGFDGQVMTIFPEDQGLASLYGNGDVKKDDPARPGAVLGVPAITPSLVATLQVMEVIKILLDRGNPFRNKLVHVDLESGQFNHFSFG